MTICKLICSFSAFIGDSSHSQKRAVKQARLPLPSAPLTEVPSHPSHAHKQMWFLSIPSCSGIISYLEHSDSQTNTQGHGALVEGSVKQDCPLPSGTATQPPTQCCPRLNLTPEIEQEKVTPPGTCHVHRGLSRKAHREFHPGLCLSPAQENPCPVGSRRAHMAYLGKEIQQPPLGTAQSSVWGNGDAFSTLMDLGISSLKEYEAFSLGLSFPHFKILLFKVLHWWDWALTAQKTN